MGAGSHGLDGAEEMRLVMESHGNVMLVALDKVQADPRAVLTTTSSENHLLGYRGGNNIGKFYYSINESIKYIISKHEETTRHIFLWFNWTNFRR